MPAESQVDNRFDPATAERGDAVLGLVLDSIQRNRTPTGELVGSARFSGVVTVSGETISHPDGADYPYPCFEADSASARRLPRWTGDERRSWFCLESPADARTRLGGAEPNRRATIRIDRFTVHRNLSDAVNSARLVAVDSVQSGAAVAGDGRCFETPTSMLARRPGTVAPGPAGLTGWLRLDGPVTASNGVGRIGDSDGRSLGARWTRVRDDSILVVAFDDFLRVEMRLANGDTLTGTAIARSDAATERDSAGRQVPFERRWTVSARKGPCGNR